MNFDHVALVSKDIKKTVQWYVNNWQAKILYLDDTWGLIEVGKSKIAFVSPSEHPAHICFEVDEEFIVNKLQDKTFKAHRDGSSSCYLRDPDDNFLEFLYWPKNEVKDE